MAILMENQPRKKTILEKISRTAFYSAILQLKFSVWAKVIENKPPASPIRIEHRNCHRLLRPFIMPSGLGDRGTFMCTFAATVSAHNATRKRWKWTTVVRSSIYMYIYYYFLSIKLILLQIGSGSQRVKLAARQERKGVSYGSSDSLSDRSFFNRSIGTYSHSYTRRSRIEMRWPPIRKYLQPRGHHYVARFDSLLPYFFLYIFGILYEIRVRIEPSIKIRSPHY